MPICADRGQLEPRHSVRAFAPARATSASVTIDSTSAGHGPMRWEGGCRTQRSRPPMGPSWRHATRVTLPLVLVHGANGDRDTFALIEGLLAERHSVWVYSRRGRGGSGDGPDYSLQKEVDDVLALLAAAGDPAHLVGHSGGALYCLLAAMQGPPLRSLVLYEPPWRLNRFDTTVIDDVQAALDAGNADRALEIFFASVGGADHEVEVLRSLEPVWQRIREGVQRVPRETRLTPEERGRVMAFRPPDVATLYIYGEETDRRSFRPLRTLPNAYRTLSSTALPDNGTSRSLSTQRRSPRPSWHSLRLTTTECNQDEFASKKPRPASVTQTTDLTHPPTMSQAHITT